MTARYRALVTGGAGFIGSTLVDRLLAEGHTVDVVDNLSTGSLANLAEARSVGTGRFNFHQLDVRSTDLVDLMSRRKPEVLFHMAAQADVRVSVADPVLDADINILGSLRALEGARQSGVRKVVFASSGGTIYGAAERLPIKESQAQRPLSPYGVAKKTVGDYLHVYRELYGLEYTALALANVYGPRQDLHGEAGVVAIFAGRLLAGEPCMIFGDGKQTRDFVFVDDVVDAFSRRQRPGERPFVQRGHGHRDERQRPLRRHGAKRRRQSACNLHARTLRRAATELPRPEQGGYAPGLEALDDHRQGHGCRSRLVAQAHSLVRTTTASWGGEGPGADAHFPHALQRTVRKSAPRLSFLFSVLGGPAARCAALVRPAEGPSELSGPMWSPTAARGVSSGEAESGRGEPLPSSFFLRVGKRPVPVIRWSRQVNSGGSTAARSRP